MLKTVYFNPLDTKYKSVRGAVRANESFELVIRFSRPVNPDRVELVLIKEGESEVAYPLVQRETNDAGIFEFGTSLTVTSAGLYFYNFVIQGDEGTYHVGSDGNLDALLGKGNKWQLTVTDPIYAPPSWLSGGIMYQIMPDRFYNGLAVPVKKQASRPVKPVSKRLATKDGVIYRDDWDGIPEYRPTAGGKILNNDFFGGNLKGIIKKLPYLMTLGVTCIYLNPVFEARSNHKYDTGNFLRVDSDFGTEEDLSKLIKSAGKKGMRIILDGVFSHAGDDSIYFNKYGRYDSEGAYQSKDSPYYEWFDFEKFPDEYKAWWGIDTLPQINKNNKHYAEFITGAEGVLAKWQGLGIGGWRLDVADELPDGFTDAVVRRVKTVTPDALVLGEVWEDASNKISYGSRRRYFGGRQYDSVSNYPFKADILNFVRTGDGARLANTVANIINNYPKTVLDNLMNILGTHDTARVLTVLGEPSGSTESRQDRAKSKVKDLNKAVTKVKLAAALQYTLPGVPCVYYGDEAGLQGYEDPFNRKCYPWETVDFKWDKKQKNLLSWYRTLGKIRKSNADILSAGDYELVEADNGIFAFEREQGDERITVIANTRDRAYEYAIAGGPLDLVTKKPYTGVVPACGCVILRKL